MSVLLILTPEGPIVRGSAPEGLAPQPRTPPNAGQGDSRKRIVPGVKPPAGPSAEAWEGGVFLTLDQWLETRTPGAGLLLQPTDDPYRLAGALEGLGLVAVDVHRINDGRGYSLGQLLRTRIGYDGPLRALGAVTADQVFAFAAVGFNQFALRADQEAAPAVAALSTFTLTYHTGLAAGSDGLRRAAAVRAESRLALLRREAQVSGHVSGAAS